MTSGSFEPTSYIDEIIARYNTDGDIAAALEEAEQHVFNIIRNTGTGIPTVIVLEAMELWMMWLVRQLAGTLGVLAVEILEGWDDAKGERFVDTQIVLARLLKEDAMRTVLEMRIPDADASRETEG